MPKVESVPLRQNGAALRAIRQREGLTIAGLANKVSKSLAISEPHLRNIENELKSASIEHLAVIAKVLEVPLAAIRRNPGAEDAA